MYSQTKSYEQPVQRHLDLCLKKLNTVAETKPEQAEHAINQLYLRVKKQKPALIFWCESPYQMAVLPPLVASTLESMEWKQLKSRLSSYTTGSQQWEKSWKIEWQNLESRLSDLFQSVMVHHRDLVKDEQVYKNARSRLEKLLHDALRQDKLTDGLICSDKPKDTPEHYRRIKMDIGIHRFFLATRYGVDQIAGLPISQSIGEASQIEGEIANRIVETSSVLASASLGIFHGIWDSRLVTKVLPKADFLLPKALDQKQLEAAAKIKRMCNDFERSAGILLRWHTQLPPRHSPFDISELEQWQDKYGDQAKKESRLDRYMGYLQTSVEGCQEFSRLLKDEVGLRNRGTNWAPYSLQWIAFALSCRFIKADFFGKLQDDIDCLAALTHGAAGYFFSSNVCFACEAPMVLHLNAAGRPHNDQGPAAVWRDGFGVYSWRGFPIEKDLLEKKDTMNVHQINSEKNIELKRIMIDLYGESRYLLDAGARVVHQDACGILYRVEIKHQEALTMVKVRNSTPEADGTYKHYFLRVPPTMMRAKQAVAWTFGVEENDYHPDLQS